MVLQQPRPEQLFKQVSSLTHLGTKETPVFPWMLGSALFVAVMLFVKSV